jgi:hypothetical protein
MMAETEGKGDFRRHKYLDYQGYAFPWYATVIWISFVIGGLIYFVKHVLLE